jgi:fructose-bisphosphate aldolase class I
MEAISGVDKYKKELIENARKMVVKGKGLLAADESTGTIKKRFDQIEVENTLENRRAYRELLLTTNGLEEYISGVILYEETLGQSTKEKKAFADVLNEKGILIGIKVDKGTVNIYGTKGETATQGLDDLGKKCAEYYQKGARFAKWRAVLKIGENLPSQLAINENAHGLARYAIICQENGLVPIVEPEVLIDGNHTIEECAFASEKVFAGVVKALNDYNVLLEGMILKPNMITQGSESETKATATEIAWLTVRTLSRTLPASVPGVVFLSGGQSEEDASINLSAINEIEAIRPWNLSFSYGRALQYSVLQEWKGKEENFAAAQKVLLQLAKNNSEATLGKYKGGSACSTDLHVKNYVY